MDIHRCVATHRQGVLPHPYPFSREKCVTTHMTDGMDELQRVRAALREAMERKAIKNKPLAQKAGLGETSVRDLLDNEDRVPLVGRVGAGGNIVYDEVIGETVPNPPGLTGQVEALEVQGTSMLPRYSNGDVVYISATMRGISEEDIGDFCAVRLKSGETYVKQLAYGSRPGFFTLRSLNAEDIVDVEVEWAAPILFVMPRAARRLLGV